VQNLTRPVAPSLQSSFTHPETYPKFQKQLATETGSSAVVKHDSSRMHSAWTQSPGGVRCLQCFIMYLPSSVKWLAGFA